MPTGAPPELSTVPTSICPNCGYSLIGLNSIGTCPECGRSFDQSEMILYGWARGSHETVANAKKSRVAWVAVSSLLVLLFQSPVLIFDSRYLSAIIAISLASAIYLLWRRQEISHPGLVQIRLNDIGCVQYDDLAGSSIIRDGFRAHGWLIAIAVALWLVYDRVNGRLGPIAIWIWLAAVAVAGVIAWRSCKRFRRAMKNVPDGSIADVGVARHQPSLWQNIRDFRFEQTRSGSRRLTIDTFHKFFANNAIDAEIQCTDEQLQAIEAFITRQIAAARRKRSAAGK
jgi:uncharacterized protein YjiS (DUF1127 family)